MSNDMSEKDESANFSKWQERTHQLRTHSINLFLSITLATIAFVISQILNKEFIFSNCWSKVLLSIGVLTLLITAVTLLLTTINRLASFKLTTQIVRKKGEKDFVNNKALMDDVKALREKVNILDQRTIIGFKISVILFLIGEFFTMVGFIAQILIKLR